MRFEDDKIPDVFTLGKGTLEITQVLDNLRKDEKMNLIGLLKDLDALDKARSNYLLTEYIHKIKMPQFNSTDEMMSWVLDQAIFIYLTSELDNDFVFLHGVTSAWALKHTLKCLESEKDRLEAIRVHLTILFMAYLGQGCPVLLVDRVKETEELPSWVEIRDKAFAVKKFFSDEHVFKLIQVI